jgi:hypothetical protein
MKDKEHKIYCLKCPITLEIRYIGRTTQLLKHRLSKHILCLRCTYKDNWIRSLHKKNLMPLIELIEICPNHSECSEREKYYISYYKTIGCRLTNMTKGGEGSDGYKHTQESIIKITIANKMTEEKREKLKKAATKQWNNMTEQEKLNNMLNQKGRRNIIQTDFEGTLIREFLSTRQIERETGFFRAAISAVLKGQLKQAYGYLWKYK